jgi:hypothetical protein
MSHLGKGKVTVEKGFYNRGVKMRLSLVNLGRIESSKGRVFWKNGLWDGGVIK